MKRLPTSETIDGERARRVDLALRRELVAPIALKNADGVFAMEIGAFKKYFAGFGVAV